MKYLKKYKLFESINEEDIKSSDIEPYLIDFKQLGCTWTISFPWSREIKFPKNRKYISSINLKEYCTPNLLRTLDIKLRPEGDILGQIKMSLEEFTDAVNLISDYLSIEHGLELNYIHTSDDWSYLYFSSLENILKLEYERIIANRIILSFK
jgi:hypothetical protein